LRPGVTVREEPCRVGRVQEIERFETSSLYPRIHYRSGHNDQRRGRR
jgi:hypothetical protein